WAGALLSVILAVAIGRFIALRISRSITESITSLSYISTEIASTVEQHERTATQQAALVNETTATMEELGVSSRQSAEQAEAAATVAQKTSSLSAEGIETVNEAAEGMVKLKERVEAVAQQILLLSEQTTQIGNISNVVKDLAGQTNMLALNAAVEAARAGEQGRGFAVVAAEIRKLADQSKKSAEQANAIIADIQKATNTTVMVTEEGTKTVESVTRLAGKVAEAFTILSASSGEIYENAQQVMLTAKQQAEAIKQVIEAISNIAAGAKDTAAGISQTRVGIQKLDETAQDLKRIV
ncbi:MAG: chemotaxis protein, partial [Nitrospirales bacterium]|nr:chemotaxis protein [Nitrospirales bacterium]